MQVMIRLVIRGDGSASCYCLVVGALGIPGSLDHACRPHQVRDHHIRQQSWWRRWHPWKLPAHVLWCDVIGSNQTYLIEAWLMCLMHGAIWQDRSLFKVQYLEAGKLLKVLYLQVGRLLDRAPMAVTRSFSCYYISIRLHHHQPQVSSSLTMCSI